MCGDAVVNVFHTPPLALNHGQIRLHGRHQRAPLAEVHRLYQPFCEICPRGGAGSDGGRGGARWLVGRRGYTGWRGWAADKTRHPWPTVRCPRGGPCRSKAAGGRWRVLPRTVSQNGGCRRAARSRGRRRGGVVGRGSAGEGLVGGVSGREGRRRRRREGG